MTLPAEEIRQHLIETTLALMDESGISNVKARTIASAVGVSVGTIYNLFGSIDGLIQEANVRILEDFGKHALSVLNSADEKRSGETLTRQDILRDRLLGLADAYIQYVEKYHGRWGAMLAYNRNRSVEIVSDGYNRQQDELFGWIGNALKGTAVAKDEQTTRAMARALWSAVHGIVALNYIGQANEKSKLYTWRQIELLVGTFAKGAEA